MAGAASIPGSDELVGYKAVDPITGPTCRSVRKAIGVVRPTVMQASGTDPSRRRRPSEANAALRRPRCRAFRRIPPSHGRSKELYKSGGELVMPKEIEDVLAPARRHQPGVRHRPGGRSLG